jgi:ATP-dependent phosphoenolpyruvate carboxykinase
MTNVVKASRTPLPPARSIHWNPSPEELRELTSRMPNARLTEFGNFNVQTRVVSRSKTSTYIITDSPDEHTDQTLSREVGDHIAQLQESHIRDRDMLVIDGYIGNDPGYRVRTRLYIDAANANIAAMERCLYFDNEGQGGDSWDPALTVIYTPSLEATAIRRTGLSPWTWNSAASPVCSTVTTSASPRRVACACGTSSPTTREGYRSMPAAR